MLEFRRPYTTADGVRSELGFRLAFTADRRSPDVFFFSCQKLHSATPDRSGLTPHPNGTLGIARLVLGEPNPTDFQYVLQEVTGDREMETSSFAMNLALDGVAIEVATPAALAIRYGTARDERRGLSFEGIVLSVASLSALRAQLASAEVAFDARGDRIVLWLSAGPSGFIAFEEQAE